MLLTRFIIPILTAARVLPIVRSILPPCWVWAPKTCSTRARWRDRRRDRRVLPRSCALVALPVLPWALSDLIYSLYFTAHGEFFELPFTDNARIGKFFVEDKGIGLIEVAEVGPLLTERSFHFSGRGGGQGFHLDAHRLPLQSRIDAPGRLLQQRYPALLAAFDGRRDA